MPRDFYSPDGTHENMMVDTIAEEYRRREKERAIKNPEFEAVLDEIDFEEIKNILKTVFKKSGFSPDQMNFVEREDVILIDDPKNTRAAGFSGEVNAILVYANSPLHSYPENVRKLMILHLLVHEEVHAVSKFEHTGWVDYVLSKTKPTENQPLVREKTQGGYRHINRTLKIEETDEEFSLFDEGVVENLARRVILEYLRRQGNFLPAEKRQAYSKSLDPQAAIKAESLPISFAYDLPVFLIDTLVKKIATYAEIDEKTVLHAVDRGLIEGEDLRNKKLQKMFIDCLPKKFFDKLSSAKTDNDIIKLLEALKQEPVEGTIVAKIMRTLGLKK